MRTLGSEEGFNRLFSSPAHSRQGGDSPTIRRIVGAPQRRLGRRRPPDEEESTCRPYSRPHLRPFVADRWDSEILRGRIFALCERDLSSCQETSAQKHPSCLIGGANRATRNVRDGRHMSFHAGTSIALGGSFGGSVRNSAFDDLFGATGRHSQSV